MKLRYIATASVIAALLNGCGGSSSSSPVEPATAQENTKNPDTSAVIATVNGQPITEAMLDLYTQQRQARNPGSPAEQDRSAILTEVISLELASQDGEKKGVENTPEVALQIEQQRRAVIASAAIKAEMATEPVTDEELQKLYKEKIGGGSEYKARHILVEDKDKALELIAELDKGADFSEMAKENSTGPSGKSGGDLGWFSPKQMVPPFSEAVATMKKGEYTKEPVQTQFGWHIIILDDVRESTPPPFDQVKEQLKMFVQNQKIQAYISKLKEGASIDIKEAAVNTGKPAAELPGIQ